MVTVEVVHHRQALKLLKDQRRRELLANLRLELDEVGIDKFVQRRLDDPDKGGKISTELIDRLALAPTIINADKRPAGLHFAVKGWNEPQQLTLEGVARGLTNAEMAKERFLSEETIKSHMRAVLAILGAKSRAHAVAIGYQRGLIPLDFNIQA